MDKDPRTYAIIGAAMAVHRNLGPGLGEKQYQEALAIELRAQRIPFRREEPIPVTHRGEILSAPRIADFVCYDSVVVELKAADMLAGAHFAQILNYMRSSGRHTGLLLNFGQQSLKFRRVIWSAPVAQHKSA